MDALAQAENFGPADPRLASTLNNLAALLFDYGKDAESESLYRRALPFSASLLPAEEYAKKLRELADLYRADGRPRAAREMDESARKKSYLPVP